MTAPAALDDAITELMQSISANRLVIFSGAGLSKDAPSALPGAWQLAEECALRHKRNTGQELPTEIRGDLEAVARHFESAGTLSSYFIASLIDWGSFNVGPNAGHIAVADFLGAGVVEFGVTTNFDVLVEAAAENLGERDFYAALDGHEAAQVREHRTLLKIHGCSRREREATLWCHEQLSHGPMDDRIATSKQWLAGNLMDRDVLFVGYWSDWAYLNDVLATCLTSSRPRSVVLVDPCDADALQAKAPNLWSWAATASGGVQHVVLGGTEFLQRLRQRYSQTFVENVVADGRAFCQTWCGTSPAATIDLASASNDDLYELRRRVTGVGSKRPVRHRAPEPAMALPGALMVRLSERGGTLSGPDLLLDGWRIRVVNTANLLLSAAREEYGSNPQPLEEDVITICAGALDDGGAASHILREGTPATVVRPQSTGRWMTHDNAITLLGI